MNKNIKLLVESFFDDDIFSENTLDDNLEDLGRYYKFDDLYQCKSIDDIRVYIDDTYNIKEKLIYIINNFEDILSHNKINNEYINKINSSSVRLALPLSDNFTLLQWDQAIQQIVDLTTNTPILNEYESIPDYNLSVISNGGLIISPTETPNVLQVNYTSSNIGNTYHLQFKLNDNTNININLTIEEPIL